MPGTNDLRGRLVDLDSHLMPPPALIDYVFEDTSFRAAERLLHGSVSRRNHASFDDYRSAVLAEGTPNSRSIWGMKDWAGFGAFDAAERLTALDLLGIARQLVLPTAMWDCQYGYSTEAFEACRRHNDWMLDWASGSGGRLIPAMIVNTNDVFEAEREAARVIASGARAVQVACYTPPGGYSPADPIWSDFWAQLSEAEVLLVFHLFGQEGFIDYRWAAHPLLEAQPLGGGGEDLGPLGLITMHLAAETYLTAMVLGGVLARFPNLRIAVTELGARWIGSWCDRLDAAAEIFWRRFAGTLEETPSEYVRRQVRVTPLYREPVGDHIRRWGLEEVFVFSTDFPHKEGGLDPFEQFATSLEGLAATTIERFFVTNGDEVLR